MNVQRLWHYLAVVFIVVGIVGLSIKHIFVDQSKWERVSGQSLFKSLQTEITQVYWQWQQSGRPASIVYRPEHATNGKVINIDSEGRLVFEHTAEGCEEFLSWFVEQKALNYQVQVSTTLYGQSSQREESFVCRFEYASYEYLYDTNTRELKLTQVE
jgi:uncharacterized membrane protein